jgi:hypothetical protein
VMLSPQILFGSARVRIDVEEDKNEKGTDLRLLNGDKMPVIKFDADAHWDGDQLIFWASRDGERIRCLIGRRSINDLPGFTTASSQEIGARKLELVALIKPNAANMILAGKYSPDLKIKTVQVYWEEKLQAGNSL